MAKYTPKTIYELKYLIEDESIYLGDIDTSNITDMFQLFEKVERRDFSGIDSWDTSKVIDMSYMFCNAKSFNENINSWDTSKVVNMAGMFSGAELFNQPLDKWNTSNVVSMNGMFDGAKAFNQPLDKWDTSNVVNMADMFMGAKSFKQNIDSWNVSNVKVNEIRGGMFKDSNMENLPIWWSSKKINWSDWSESEKITNTSISKSIIKFIEKDAQSNKYVPKTRNELWALCYDKSISLGDIDTSNIVDMSYLFKDNDRRDFSGIDSWDTSKVISMASMFFSAKSFNENINSWNTSSVVSMDSMFCAAEKFNKPLDNWDTSNVVDMFSMFSEAKSFNQSLDNWDTSNVVDMAYMFKGAKSFNQNINSWDVSSVRDNQEMFWDSGVSKLPKWYKKRTVSNRKALTEAKKKYVKEAIANPRPKKPKIPPQDKPQSNSVNDLISTWFGFDSSKPPSKGKAILSVIVLIAIFAIFRIIDKSEDSQNNNKATTQSTQTAQLTQQQPAQQPTANMPRCDDSGLLNHLIKTYKNFLVDVYQDADLFTKWQGYYQQQGINVTSAEEIVNSFKYNIINVQTKSSDEVNRQITCEVEIEEVHPIPQYKPYYSILDYRARITDKNSVEVEWLDMRGLDK